MYKPDNQQIRHFVSSIMVHLTIHDVDHKLKVTNVDLSEKKLMLSLNLIEDRSSLFLVFSVLYSLFCLSSSYVLCTSVSGLSVLACSSVFSNVYLIQK